MKLPLSIGKKLLQLVEGQSIPSSQFPKQWQELLLEEGILEKQVIGRTKYRLHLHSESALQRYLTNKYNINDLAKYIYSLEKDNLTGAEAQEVASNSKLRKSSFSGFLVSSNYPVQAKLGGQDFIIQSIPGSFVFIEDYPSFSIPKTFTVVGIENPENFKNPLSNDSLFNQYNPLYVCRYPQSNALVTWLRQIPNPYLHFGDFDLAGIAIYEREFRRWLGKRASFFIPANIRTLIKYYGNRTLYEQQFPHYRNFTTSDPKCRELLDIMHELRMGLEQEYFVRSGEKGN